MHIPPQHPWKIPQGANKHQFLKRKMRFLYIAADNFRHPKEKSERIEPLNEIIRNVDILLQF